MGVSDDDYPDFREALKRLERRGRVYRVRGGRYGVPDDLGVVVGRLQTIDSGAGFVIPDEGDQDVYVRRGDLGSAVDRDRVAVRVEEQAKRGPRGRVIEVLERAQTQVVGVIHAREGYARLDVTEPRIDLEVYLPQTGLADARDGDLALVEITEWGDRGDRHPMPAGRVERVLGRPGDPGADVLAIQLGFGFDDQFPDEVQDEAESIAARGIRPQDIDDRDDFRADRVVTIDPADARDHDDAVSIHRLDDGTAWIGIHIADVSHYVPRRSVIDDEAWERGTSVYLVDRVIPMLPHALSSDLCSLVPGEDRLTLTALIRVRPDGSVAQTRFAKGVIRSAHRLSYEDAQAILDGKDERDPELTRDLTDLLRFSRAFRTARSKRGSLDFDLPESRVVLDEEGAPIDVMRVERLAAHELIEDLMIAANEAVARWAIEQGVPLLFRIHEEPNPEKLEDLRALAAEFGLSFPKGGAAPRDFQRLIEGARGKPEEAIISIGVLRSMAQARYATSNEGHFGLASQAYLHFTSPIRRYPDLVVHRQLARWLADPATARNLDSGWLEETARQASARERLAQQAERDSIDLKKVEFMERHLGDTFKATISGVAAFGFFVRLDRYDIDGLVHVSALGDDYYVLEEGKHRLRGRRTRQTFQLGDPVEVRVTRVDREERKIDFEPVESDKRRSG